MTAGQPLAYHADCLPRAANRQRVDLGFQHWQERLDRLDDAALAQFGRELAQDADGKALLEALFANSPFLGDCALTDMAGLRELLQRGPDAVLADQIARVHSEADTEDVDTCMRVLRQCRRRTALGAALADITGTWDLDQVTRPSTPRFRTRCASTPRAVSGRWRIRPPRRKAAALPSWRWASWAPGS